MAGGEEKNLLSRMNETLCGNEKHRRNAVLERISMNGYLFQGECERCEGKGETHGHNCIVRKVIFNSDLRRHSKKASLKEAMEAAIKAIETAFERDKNTAL